MHLLSCKRHGTSLPATTKILARRRSCCSTSYSIPAKCRILIPCVWPTYIWVTLRIAIRTAKLQPAGTRRPLQSAARPRLLRNWPHQASKSRLCGSVISTQTPYARSRKPPDCTRHPHNPIAAARRILPKIRRSWRSQPTSQPRNGAKISRPFGASLMPRTPTSS